MSGDESDAADLFLNRVPYQILSALSDPMTDNYAKAISRKADTTYSHTVKTLQRMEQHDLVEFEEKGRKKITELTEKGKRSARYSLKLVQSLQNESM